LTFDHKKITPGYFGKLPNFADFIKYNASGEELLTFDKWIQEGILNSKFKFKDRWEEIYKNSPSYNFLYNCHGAKNFLAGNLFPSKDKISREYPFLTTLRFDKSLITGDQIFQIPLLLKSFSEKMSEIYDFAVKCSNSAELNNFVENSEFDFEIHDVMMDEYKEYLNRTELAYFWDRVLDEPDEQQKWIIINNLFLFSSIQNSAAGNKGLNSSVSFSIKFPLSGENDYCFLDTAFWIHLFLNIYLRKKNLTREFASLIWSYPGSGNFNSLFIIIGKLSPENFRELMNPDYSGSNSIRIVDNYDTAGELNYLPHNLRTLMENKYLTLSDLLNSA
jgi:type VI secretion system ImpM family protein